MKTLNDKLNWARNQQWFKDMEQCQQNPEWHEEGNVLVHTLKVCEALSMTDEYNNLTENEKEIVEWAAIFHDSAKPFTTSIKDGEIVTSHHSSNGVFIARKALFELGLPVRMREDICNLVRYHMFPTKIDNAQDPVAHVVFTSWLCRNHLLSVLSEADILGRTCWRKGDNLVWLSLWNEKCKEFACFDKPYDFVNSQARIDFYNSKHFQPYYHPFMDDKFEVVILSGLPGVGKSHLAKTEFKKYPLIELDMVREDMGVDPGEEEGQVQQETKERCCKLLREKSTFVFGAVNHLKKTRRRWISLFRGYGAKVKIIYMELPLDIILKQNKNRLKVVPEGVIREMLSRLEVPNWDESHELEIKTEEQK